MNVDFTDTDHEYWAMIGRCIEYGAGRYYIRKNVLMSLFRHTNAIYVPWTVHQSRLFVLDDHPWYNPYKIPGDLL